MILTRKAGTADAPAMAELLNAIIETGGTTALTTPVTAEDMIQRMRAGGERAAWHVAFDNNDTIVGFQWIGPHDNLPVDACDIATFVQEGRTGLGIGSALFNATRDAAERLGYAWINATIRADNEGGLIYYQSRGFEDWHVDKNVALSNGLIVNKISKRYDFP
jgi:L-amino acid N-acyltransferase YncA